MNIDLTSAQAKALVRQLEKEQLDVQHQAVDELCQAIICGLEKDGDTVWDCEWCGKSLRTVEDFEDGKCADCRERVALMEIADLRAIRREMERESIGRLPYVVGR